MLVVFQKKASILNICITELGNDIMNKTTPFDFNSLCNTWLSLPLFLRAKKLLGISSRIKNIFYFGFVKGQGNRDYQVILFGPWHPPTQAAEHPPIQKSTIYSWERDINKQLTWPIQWLHHSLGSASPENITHSLLLNTVRESLRHAFKN